MNTSINPVEMPAALRAAAFSATTKVLSFQDLKSDLPDDVRRRARELSELGRCDEAIEAVSAVTNWESDYVALSLVGAALLQKEQYASALPHFQAMYSLSEKESEDARPLMKSIALNNQAMVHLMQRNYDEALTLINGAIATFDQWPGVWNSKLSILNQMKRQDAFPATFAAMQQRFPQYEQDAHFRRQLKKDRQMVGVLANLNAYRESKGLAPVFSE